MGAEIEDHDLYGANIRLNGGDPLFDGVILDGVEDVTGSGTAFLLDVPHQLVQTILVAATAQRGVIALPRKAFRHIAADARARAHDQTDRFHGLISPEFISARQPGPDPHNILLFEAFAPLRNVARICCQDLLAVFHGHGRIHAGRIDGEIQGILGQTQAERGIGQHGLDQVVGRGL